MLRALFIVLLAVGLSQFFLTACSAQKAGMKDGKPDMQTITENDTPFACNMSALKTDEKKRVLELLENLKTRRQEIKELPDGFAFRYSTDNEIIKNTAEFIALERLCCPFFEFDLTVEKENGATWLQLSGREGVKDFIKIEFGF